MRAPTPALLVLLITLAMHAGAQEASKDSAASPARDTLPFHKGQWAAQFVAGTQFVSAGVLHFRSPRSAWLIDGSVRYTHIERRGNALVDTLIVPATATSWSATGTVRFGLRNYKPLGNATQLFVTYGLLLLGGGSENTILGQTTDAWTWGAGAFGEFGANYMLTPHIGLGAAAGVQAAYSQAGFGKSAATREIGVSGALLSLQLGIYF